jgi:plastocyanin
VEFPNDDPDYHNVYSLSRPLRFDLGRYKRDEAPPPAVTFSTAGLVRLQCEIHEHMRAVVLVVPSGHFTTTEPSGEFRLGGLPAGRFTLRAQLDEKTQWSAEVTIAAGTTVTPVFAEGSPSAAAR